MRVNLHETKVMNSYEDGGTVITEGAWPCTLCIRVIGLNYILCSACGMWVHKICSKISGRLQNIGAIECETCRRQ